MAQPSLQDIFSTVNGLWIRTEGPKVLYWNPVIEGPDSKAELVSATSYYEFIHPNDRVHTIPFWAM